MPTKTVAAPALASFAAWLERRPRQSNASIRSAVEHTYKLVASEKHAGVAGADVHQ